MTAPSARNVAAPKPKAGGGVYYAPLGTTLPTDATTALDAAFLPLGYVSDEGIKPSRDTTIEKPKAWGGDIVAQLLTDDSSSFEFTLLEVFAANVNKFVYGSANVTVTAATSSSGTITAVQDKGGKPLQCILAFDMLFGAKAMRIVVPLADPTVTGEEPLVDGALNAYDITVEALKDASGVRVYRYLVNDDKTS